MGITLDRRGINYGHHLTPAKPYAQRVRHDLRVLWRAGYRHIRPGMPAFDNSAASITMQRYIVEAALSMGFQVLYGVVSGGGPLVTPARQAAHLAYVQGTVAPYVAGLGNPNCVLVIDNELEEHLDPSLTVAASQAAQLAAAAAIRAAYPSMTITTVAAGLQITPWTTSGTGVLDYLGLNLYYGWATNDPGGFTAALVQAVAAFGARLYISEWGTQNGYPDALTYGTTTPEQDYADAMGTRLEQIERYRLPHAVFSFSDGAFGVPKDSFALRTSSGRYRRAWYRINRLKEPT